VAVDRIQFENGSLIKNEAILDYPMELTLLGVAYGIFALVHHEGQAASSGHFSSFVFLPSAMILRCNDEEIGPADISAILEPEFRRNICCLVYASC
jgi:hypothetical protein